MVMFNVRQYFGVEFVWPSDYLPATAAVGGFDLGPGQDLVVRARWPAALVPPAGTHACWLAAVLSRADRPPAGAHVWEHGNLAQTNLTSTARSSAGSPSSSLSTPMRQSGRR